MPREPGRAAGVREGAAAPQLAAALLIRLLALPHLFPLCTTLFRRGFESYAAFGTFGMLLLMDWAFLVGVVLVLGAERVPRLARRSPRAAPSAPPNERPVGLT